MTRKPKGYSNEIKQEVISAILSGELLLKEVMRKHGIKSQRTVISWLREALKGKKHNKQNKKEID